MFQTEGSGRWGWLIDPPSEPHIDSKDPFLPSFGCWSFCRFSFVVSCFSTFTCTQVFPGMTSVVAVPILSKYFKLCPVAVLLLTCASPHPRTLLAKARA